MVVIILIIIMIMVIIIKTTFNTVSFYQKILKQQRDFNREHIPYDW